MKLSAEEVKVLRESAGLTRQQLADKCNVVVDTVRGWEGIYPPGGLASAFIKVICAEAKRKRRAA